MVPTDWRSSRRMAAYRPVLIGRPLAAAVQA
jgi:hypothetical protein